MTVHSPPGDRVPSSVIMAEKHTKKVGGVLYELEGTGKTFVLRRLKPGNGRIVTRRELLDRAPESSLWKWLSSLGCWRPSPSGSATSNADRVKAGRERLGTIWLEADEARTLSDLVAVGGFASKRDAIVAAVRALAVLLSKK